MCGFFWEPIWFCCLPLPWQQEPLYMKWKHKTSPLGQRKNINPSEPLWSLTAAPDDSAICHRLHIYEPHWLVWKRSLAHIELEGRGKQEWKLGASRSQRVRLDSANTDDKKCEEWAKRRENKGAEKRQLRVFSVKLPSKQPESNLFLSPDL